MKQVILVVALLMFASVACADTTLTAVKASDTNVKLTTTTTSERTVSLTYLKQQRDALTVRKATVVAGLDAEIARLTKAIADAEKAGVKELAVE